MKPLKQLVRPNIWDLIPRHQLVSEQPNHKTDCCLNMNENPYNKPFNRYPDPFQAELKDVLSEVKQIPTNYIFLGNGLDEMVDFIYRIFCEPKSDNVVAIAPTRTLYEIYARINNVKYLPVLLDEHFGISAKKILSACNHKTKVIWLCSPNSPTGNCIEENIIKEVLQSFQSIVVLDESYIDFSKQASFRKYLAHYPNLIILDSMSKAWACASLRLSMGYAHPEIIEQFNKITSPYHISTFTQQQATATLKDRFEVEKRITTIVQECKRMQNAFSLLPQCVKVFPSKANFFLAKMNNVQEVYNFLIQNNIYLYNCTNMPLCNNCLRISVGSKTDNNKLLAMLR